MPYYQGLADLYYDIFISKLYFTKKARQPRKLMAPKKNNKFHEPCCLSDPDRSSRTQPKRKNSDWVS